MDFSKYPLERIFYLIAGVIPGFVALLIFELASPGSFGWFFTLGFLGYKTKLSVIFLAAFLVGNSMTTFLFGILGGIGGAIGGAIARRPYKPSHSYDIAPWRVPRWRALLKSHLGSRAPNDTNIITQQVFEIRRETIGFLPEKERPAAIASLDREKTEAEIDDSNWAQWYEHYHQIVFFRARQDFHSQVRHGLNFNLETAALYTLISALVVPSLRCWWCILLACMWVLLLIAFEYSEMVRMLNKWSTLSDQIKYFSEGEYAAETSEIVSRAKQ